MKGRNDEAVDAYLDTIRLGRALQHGGLLTDWIVGATFEGMGCAGIRRLGESLSARQCAAAASALRELQDQPDSYQECLERDAIWCGHAFGWTGRLAKPLMAMTGTDPAVAWLNVRWRDRDLTKMRLLICDLAIRAYSLQRGRKPAKLDDLVPDYLPEVPKDPFSGKELVYRVTPTGYLLYSVGVDGKDDGGKSCGPTGLEEPGDILLDDPPSPPGPVKMPGS